MSSDSNGDEKSGLPNVWAISISPPKPPKGLDVAWNGEDEEGDGSKGFDESEEKLNEEDEVSKESDEVEMGKEKGESLGEDGWFVSAEDVTSGVSETDEAVAVDEEFS